MKIVYIIDHLRPDGTQQFLRYLVQGLAQREYYQAVVCLNDSWDATIVTELQAAGAEVRIVGKRELIGGIGLLTLWLWLRQRHFDRVVTLLLFSDIIGRSIGHLLKVPQIISSLRARNIHYHRWQLWLSRHTMQWANWVVLNSSHLRPFAVAHEGVKAEQVVVIPNGVSLPPVITDVHKQKSALGIPHDAIVLGSVGRLTIQKGFDVLLRAVARLEQSNIHLVLVGSGNQHEHLVAQTQVLGIANQVHFLGQRRDVPAILAMLDVYVHPARWEGMPNALLEAMAVGCPIVASDVDGNRELIEDGVHGWLVPPDDASALSKAIATALAEPIIATSCGQAAQQRAQTTFSLEVMVDAWEHTLRRGPRVADEQYE